MSEADAEDRDAASVRFEGPAAELLHPGRLVADRSGRAGKQDAPQAFVRRKLLAEEGADRAHPIVCDAQPLGKPAVVVAEAGADPRMGAPALDDQEGLCASIRWHSLWRMRRAMAMAQP